MSSLSTVMPLSAAEKQRRYRARQDANPERRLHYLEKERLAWQEKRSTGKVKSSNANPAGTISEQPDQDQKTSVVKLS